MRPSKFIFFGTITSQISTENTKQHCSHYYEKKIHAFGTCGCVCGGMPDGAADASEQPGDGRSNSLEPRAVRYELFVGNRTSPFDERKSTRGAGNLPFRLRRAALGIYGRCDRLRKAQDIY